MAGRGSDGLHRVNVGLPFVISIAGGNEMAEAVTAEHPRLLFGLNVDAVANAALTGWRTVSGNKNLKLRIANARLLMCQ